MTDKTCFIMFVQYKVAEAGVVNGEEDDQPTLDELSDPDGNDTLIGEDLQSPALPLQLEEDFLRYLMALPNFDSYAKNSTIRVAMTKTMLCEDSDR